MYRKNWNEDWLVLKSGETPHISTMMGTVGKSKTVTLPYDAMIHEKKTPDTKNQHQTGFYPGGCYTYLKYFTTPEEWKGKNIYLEFEGVYCNARVYINGDLAGGCPNGYSEFCLCIDDYLKYGQKNEVKVIANNTEENSRWYSGSGIYRNVNLMVADYIHIENNGVKILTREADKELAIVQIETMLVNTAVGQHSLKVITKIYNPEGEIIFEDNIPVTVYNHDKEFFRQAVPIENPILWDTETPELYTAILSVMEDGKNIDTVEESFGIRTVSVDAKRGLRLNGKEVKLRGTCIHHDNGIIGAVTLKRAEERKCRQLKEAGFNCIRSAHHPMSRSMLNTCDRLGMLVIDELADSWTRSKNNNDYAEKFPDYWERDIEKMVTKDFNHPCVIMYITGNEIQEASSPRGAQLNRRITEKFHKMDDSRPVTVAINGLLASMEYMGEILSDTLGISLEQFVSSTQSDQTVSDAGSDAANGVAAMLRGKAADRISISKRMTSLIDEFASVTDIVGYNYMTARHEYELQIHPGHVVLGTETFPSDIARLWKIVKNNKHVIGDMTWTGYDYLGEAGANFFYYDGRSGFQPNWPISLACMGDIDIIGCRKPISYYREIIYGLRKEPYIGVESPEHYGIKPNQSAWGLKDDIASWTWHGYEKHPIVVNVYSDSDEVELMLNGRSLGRKPSGEKTDFLTVFELEYEPGSLEAVNWRDGKKAESFALETASDEVQLQLITDQTKLKADGADLAYLTVTLIDKQGRENQQAVKTVSITVEGVGTLQGFGSADPETLNDYDNNVWDTYHGHLLAVIRSGKESGDIYVTVQADGCESQTLILNVG